MKCVIVATLLIALCMVAVAAPPAVVLPCPYCGLRPMPEWKGHKVRMACPNDCLKGPRRKDIGNAIADWNEKVENADIAIPEPPGPPIPVE